MTDREKLIGLIYEGCSKHDPCPGVGCFVCIADYLFDNGVTFATDNHVGGKWIPVTERLPELGKNVLMYFKDGDTVVSGFLAGGEPGRATWWGSFTEGDWYTECDSSPDYWMSVPERPADMRKGENG